MGVKESPMAQSQIKTRQDVRDVVVSFFDTLRRFTLLKFANALQHSRPDSEQLVRRLLEKTGETRKLAGGGRLPQ
jgi:hypothetical protein